MSKVVKVKAQKFVLSGGGQTDEGYRYTVVPEAYIGPDAFSAKLADEMGTPSIIAKAWMDAFARVMSREVMNNMVVNPGWCLGQLHVSGSTPTAVTGKLDKSVTPVVARLSFTGPIAAAAKDLEAINMTLTIEASLQEVYERGNLNPNQLTEAGKIVAINGRGLFLDVNVPDEYVALYKDNTLIQSAEIVYSDASTITCRFPSLPAGGTYDLVVSTRNGESPDEYATKVLRRKVTVLGE